MDQPVTPPSQQTSTPPQTEAAVSPQQDTSAQPPTTTNDLASLLEEFNAATAKPKEESKPANAENSPADPTKDLMAEFDKSLGAMGMSAGLRQHLQTYATTVHAMQAQQMHEKAKADFNGIVDRFDKAAREAGYPISEDYARRWLTAESVTNQRLVEAFDHRYDSAEAARRADKMVKKAREKFLAAAKKEPDPQATADRAAVTWAVRNTTTVAPPAPPVRYGDLTDAEFEAEVKKYVK
jgi:hypothetical protein